MRPSELSSTQARTRRGYWLVYIVKVNLVLSSLRAAASRRAAGRIPMGLRVTRTGSGCLPAGPGRACSIDADDLHGAGCQCRGRARATTLRSGRGPAGPAGPAARAERGGATAVRGAALNGPCQVPEFTGTSESGPARPAEFLLVRAGPGPARDFQQYPADPIS